MKRMLIIFYVVLLTTALIMFLTQQINKTNDYVYFGMRYNFTTNLVIKYPEKLKRKDFKKYFYQFQTIGSNLSYFDSFNLTTSPKVILDLKTKYIYQIDLVNLTVDDLNIFNLTQETKEQIYYLLKQDLTQKEKQTKIEQEDSSDEFIWTKGLKRLIIF